MGSLYSPILCVNLLSWNEVRKMNITVNPNSIEKYEGYDVYEITLKDKTQKVMLLEDVKEIVNLLEKMYPKKEDYKWE